MISLCGKNVFWSEHKNIICRTFHSTNPVISSHFCYKCQNKIMKDYTFIVLLRVGILWQNLLFLSECKWITAKGRFWNVSCSKDAAFHGLTAVCNAHAASWHVAWRTDSRWGHFFTPRMEMRIRIFQLNHSDKMVLILRASNHSSVVQCPWEEDQDCRTAYIQFIRERRGISHQSSWPFALASQIIQTDLQWYFRTMQFITCFSRLSMVSFHICKHFEVLDLISPPSLTTQTMWSDSWMLSQDRTGGPI